MLTAREKQASFSAGEVGRLLRARDDLARHHVGLAAVENLVVLLEGGLTRRPGTRFLIPYKNEAQAMRFVRFRFSGSDSYQLVLNGGVMRLLSAGGVVLSGGVPYELAIPWAAADLDNLRVHQDGNQLYCFCNGYQPRVINRLGHTNWTIGLYQPAGGPVDTQNLDEAKTVIASGPTGNISLAGVGTAWDAGDIGGVIRLDEPDLIQVPAWAANETLSSPDAVIAASGFAFGNMATSGNAFDGTTSQGSGLSAARGAVNAYIGKNYSANPQKLNRAKIYGSNNVGFWGGPDAQINIYLYGSQAAPANGTDGVLLGSISFIDTGNESGGRVIYSNDASTAWNYLWCYIEYTGAAGATLYVAELQFYYYTGTPSNLRRYNGRVYQALNDGNTGTNPPTHEEGDVSSGRNNINWRFKHNGYGFVRITAVTDATHASGTVLGILPDSVVAGPTYRWWPPAWSPKAGWPERVAGHDGRLFCARGPDWWLTRPSDLNSLEVLPTAEDSGIAARLKGRRSELPWIEWALSAGVLLLGTRDCPFVLRAPNLFDPITTENLKTYPDGKAGSASVEPCDVSDGCIFVDRSRKKLLYAKFDKLPEAVSVEEVTISNREIMAGRGAELAYQEDPHRIVWGRCEDGSLVGITFMPEEQVIGFHRHPLTNGYVEAISAIPSSDEAVSDVYLGVRRTIAGVTRRYIEILAPWFEAADPDEPTAEGAWFADCALAYSGAPATVISGLDHLEGQVVCILADGKLLPRQTVNAGAVTLPIAAASVVVGLPIRWYVKSLPQEIDTPAGTSKGLMKRASRVVLDLIESGGGAVSVNGGLYENIQETGTMDYDAPLDLLSGQVTVIPESPTSEILEVELVGDDPLPFTLAGWAIPVTIVED